MRYPVLFCLLGGACMGAQPAPAGLDALSPDDVAKAISALKENYVRPDQLTDSEIAHATLQGLLDRLDPAVSLTGTTDAAPASPFYCETFRGLTGYLRPGGLTPANLEETKESLAGWTKQGLAAVVLDLRGTPRTTDFDAGAALERLFCAKGTEMFSLKAGGHLADTATVQARNRTFSADADPLFKGILVVLVDGETAGAPEAVAASLRKCASALIVGDKTAGRAFEYQDIPLDGEALRVAVAQVMLPDGKEPGENGLSPDISVGMGAVSKKEVMQSITANGVESVIEEHDRPHLNEAALVSGSNPDLDELEAEASGQKPPELLIDRQLQRALDLVTSISIYQAKATDSPQTGE
jgi:hypothetical protein